MRRRTGTLQSKPVANTTGNKNCRALHVPMMRKIKTGAGVSGQLKAFRPILPLAGREIMMGLLANKNFGDNSWARSGGVLHRLSLFHGFDEQRKFGQLVAAQVRDPQRRVDEHVTSPRRGCCLWILAF
jgi:hypothetical protein